MADVSYKKYQTFSQRLGAAILDGIIFIPIVLLGTAVFGPDEQRSITWLLLQNAIYFTYSIIGHHKYGQTLGKKWMYVKVVQDADETKLLSLVQAVKRDIIGILFVALEFFVLAFGDSESYIGDFIIGFSSFVWLTAELVTMLFNPKRRSVHDYIAGAVCIDVTKPTEWERSVGL